MRPSDEGRWEATRACLDCVRQEYFLGDAEFEVGPEAAPAHPACESRFRAQTPAPVTPSESHPASPHIYSSKVFKMPTLRSRLPRHVNEMHDDEISTIDSTFISELYGRDMPSVQAGTEEFFALKRWGKIPIVLLQQHFDKNEYEVEKISTSLINFETPITVLLISLLVDGDEAPTAHAMTVFKKKNEYWIFDSLGNNYAMEHYGPKLIEWVQEEAGGKPNVNFIELPMHNIEYKLNDTNVQMCWPFAMYAISVFKNGFINTDEEMSKFKDKYLKEHTQVLQKNINKLQVRASKALIKHFVLPLFDNVPLSPNPTTVAAESPNADKDVTRKLFSSLQLRS